MGSLAVESLPDAGLAFNMEKPAPVKRASRKRKRSDAISEDSDESAKRRGRPRTEKADESAQDVSIVLHICILYLSAPFSIDILASVDGRKSAWPKEHIGKGKKLRWMTCASASPTSPVPLNV